MINLRENLHRNLLDIPLHNPFAPLRQTMQKMHNLRTKGLPYQGLHQELDRHTVLYRHTVWFTLLGFIPKSLPCQGFYVRVGFTSKGLPPLSIKGGGAVAGDINTHGSTSTHINLPFKAKTPTHPLSGQKEPSKKIFYSLEFVDIKSRREEWQDFLCVERWRGRLKSLEG